MKREERVRAIEGILNKELYEELGEEIDWLDLAIPRIAQRIDDAYGVDKHNIITALCLYKLPVKEYNFLRNEFLTNKDILKVEVKDE